MHQQRRGNRANPARGASACREDSEAARCPSPPTTWRRSSARYHWGLHVADGLAVTYHWVARAQPGVYAAAAADSHQVSYYRDPIPRASYRAARRALLEELQRYVDEHPTGIAASLAPEPAASDDEMVWY